MSLLTAAEIRSRVSALARADNFTDEAIDDLVEEFTDIAERYRGVSYVQRTTTETRFIDTPTTSLELWHRPARLITSITVADVALTADDYVFDQRTGTLHGAWFPAGATVVVTYTHGLGARQITDGVTIDTDTTVTSATANFGADDVGKPISGTGIPTDTTVASINSTTSIELSAAATASGTGVTLTIGEAPKPLLRACREYVRVCALADRSGVPRDVIGQSFGDGGYTRFSTPDMAAGRPTGYLEVDRLLNSLDSFHPYCA